MMTHTPGPWCWTDRSDKGHEAFSLRLLDGTPIIIPALKIPPQHAERVMAVKPLFQITNIVPNEYDAYLIAAAPELLEALKEAVQIMRGIDKDGGGKEIVYGEGDPVFDYEAIIARAEGGQPC